MRITCALFVFAFVITSATYTVALIEIISNEKSAEDDAVPHVLSSTENSQNFEEITQEVSLIWQASANKQQQEEEARNGHRQQKTSKEVQRRKVQSQEKTTVIEKGKTKDSKNGKVSRKSFESKAKSGGTYIEFDRGVEVIVAKKDSSRTTVVSKRETVATLEEINEHTSKRVPPRPAGGSRGKQRGRPAVTNEQARKTRNKPSRNVEEPTQSTSVVSWVASWLG
ncbi:hypothetical protein M514_09899 [Trichuris suis]|uniref:Uncharacterized protein n=1 Tax=Trichuris suis TaxID=68888 RepID=A0A085N815_9BILA|nr:hypothetical protein M513_09899 [Trichuris suis]KFD65611.1 hypothetical protein M514_09899 [Trichuris suis]